MLDFFSDRIHKAKKPHCCELCDGKIEIGETYHRQSGKLDYEMFDVCLHNSCTKIVDVYLEQSYENSWSPQEVYDWARTTRCMKCKEYDDCELDYAMCKIFLDSIKKGEAK